MKKLSRGDEVAGGKSGSLGLELKFFMDVFVFFFRGGVFCCNDACNLFVYFLYAFGGGVTA